MEGFTETDGNTSFAVGSVHGFRWWKIDEALMQWSLRIRLPEQPPLEPVTDHTPPVFTPLIPGEKWDLGKIVKPAGAVPRRPAKDGLLIGSMGPWKPGENTAICQRHQNRGRFAIIRSELDEDPHVAPAKGCHCGFWAYWDLNDAPHGNWDVAGVVAGYGKSTIGPLGFRVQKARIVALHLYTEIEGCDGKGRAVDDQSSALEWKMDMEEILAAHYGLDRCWSSLDAMAAAFPPNSQYASASVIARARQRIQKIRATNALLAQSLDEMKNLTDTTADTRRKFDELMKLMEADNDKKDANPHGGS